MNLSTSEKKRKPLKKITKTRLQNIGLYYLQRFESSVQNLRSVLRRRVDRYAFENKEFNKLEAYGWIEDLLEDFAKKNYVSDERYGVLKVRDYIESNKPVRYIKNKLKTKGIDEKTIDALIENENIDEAQMALNFAKKKKIGPFRENEDAAAQNRQKDMATLLRAGFEYDVVCNVLSANFDA